MAPVPPAGRPSTAPWPTPQGVPESVDGAGSRLAALAPMGYGASVQIPTRRSAGAARHQSRTCVPGAFRHLGRERWPAADRSSQRRYAPGVNASPFLPSLPGQRSPVARRTRGRAFCAGVLGLLLISLAGCGLTGGGPTFAPDGPCRVDGRAPGAYPELEALVPSRFDGRPPDRLDSGRNCSRENLAGLAATGITELRFAGGLWATGAESGVTLAVFTAPGLTVEALGAWYEAGARSARKTSIIVVGRPRLGGGAAYRIDLENGGQLQTIVVLPSAADVVRVVLVGSAARDVRTPDAHAAIVERAIAASLAAEAAGPGEVGTGAPE